MKEVAVVVLNYKVRDLTLKCVDSIKRSSFKKIKIYVVDNNSGDGIGKVLEEDQQITFIQNSQNTGFSGGNNLGLKEALKSEAEYFLILNPDTTIASEAIEIMVEKMEEYSASIICPKIYFKDGKTIWYAGGLFDKGNVLGSHRGVNERDDGQYEKDIETDGITGAAVMINRKVLDEVGLFDERYFLYYEDSDLYFRAKEKGFKIMYVAKAKVIHKNAQSTKLGSRLQDYFITRNRMLFASKFLPFRTRFALFREALRNLSNPVRRLAFFDFLIGNFGKGSFKI